MGKNKPNKEKNDESMAGIENNGFTNTETIANKENNDKVIESNYL